MNGLRARPCPPPRSSRRRAPVWTVGSALVVASLERALQPASAFSVATSLNEMAGAVGSALVVASLGWALQPASAFPVATSLNGMSGEPALLDLFKYSRHFGSPDKPWDENCTCDNATGWPTQDDFGVVIDWEPVESATLPFRATCGAEPAFDLHGTGIQVTNAKWDDASKTLTASLVTPPNCSSGCDLFLTFRNTSGGCRGVTVLQPGASPAPPGAPAQFNKAYLDAVSHFSHLRMMDWGQTNANPLAKWEERTPVDWPSYRYGRTVPSRGMAQTPTSRNTGAPYEVSAPRVARVVFLSVCNDGTSHRHFGHTIQGALQVMVDLCNAASTDCWINVPALVDEDYITNLAQLVHQRLDPKLNVYLEYSNELWNNMFPQTGWHYNFSNHSVMSGDPFHLNYDNQTLGQWTCVPWSYRHTAYTAMRIGQIFGGVFGESELPNGRVRPVLAGQVGDGPQWEGLRYLDAVHGPPSKFIHATANAPYFAMNASSASRDSPNCRDGWTADDVLNLLEAELNKPGSEGGNGYFASRDVKNAQAVSAVHALWHGVRVLTYEGGPDTSCFFENPSSVPAKLMANLAPRMQNITFQYLRGHAAHGQHYGALNWFVCCASSYDFIYGQWGISNNLYNFSKAPKWLGIQQALAAPQPTPALGAPVPGILDGAADEVEAGNRATGLFCGAVEAYYVLNAAKGGAFALALNASTTGGNATVTVGVNGAAVGEAALTPSGGVVAVPGTVTLTAGVSTLRLTMPDPPHECFRLHSIVVTQR